MADNFQVWLEKLKDNSDIVSVISRYVTLNKKGKTWWGTCPFHFEKTPSFAVNEAEQYFHCFGCGASGNVISFVKKYESVEFMEACEILAKYANMQMPTFKENEDASKLKKEREIAYKVLRDAAIHYVKNLQNYSISEKAIKYIQKRNLDSNTVNAFGIGYSAGWKNVVDYLLKLGYSINDLKIAGIVDLGSDGSYVDAYAKRLIFPIINANNDVIGFSARLLENADFAKYKNTAQTVVFDKSRVVYSINNIKKLKQTETLKEIILVEGQMDVISLYKNGVKNAVATMGTSLTPYHAKEIKRYCDKIVVCFDGDSAGIKATLRSIDILNSAGLEVYVASLPEGIDPDEFIIKYGKTEYLKLIDNALYWVEFLIYNFKKQYDLQKPNEKSDFITNALGVVKKLSSVSEQAVYLELISKITNISVNVLQNDLNSNDNQKPVVSEKVTQLTDGENKDRLSRENAYIKAVKFIMASIIHKKSFAKLNDNIKNNLLNNDYRKIYEYIEKEMANGKKVNISALFDLFDVENNEDIKDIINYEVNDTPEDELYYNNSVKLITKIGLQNEQQRLTEEYRTTNNEEDKRKIKERIKHTVIELNKLS